MGQCKKCKKENEYQNGDYICYECSMVDRIFHEIKEKKQEESFKNNPYDKMYANDSSMLYVMIPYKNWTIGKISLHWKISPPNNRLWMSMAFTSDFAAMLGIDSRIKYPEKYDQKTWEKI